MNQEFSRRILAPSETCGNCLRVCGIVQERLRGIYLASQSGSPQNGGFSELVPTMLLELGITEMNVKSDREHAVIDTESIYTPSIRDHNDL